MSDPCATGCIRGHGDRCPARRTGHARLCALARERPDYAALVDRLATEGWSPPAPPPPPPAPTELGLLRTLPPCPHVRLCGCSTPGLECGPGGVKPGARVTRQECLECLDGS